jgi:aspartyl-tRNA(Asn)/glutamyl-tRNA(Gln) amidotransferase subunit A
VSKAGVLPCSWLFDHVGPLIQTVDAALVLQALAGYDPADFSTLPLPVEDYRAGLARDVRGLRVGVPREYFFARLDHEVQAAVHAALVVLSTLGAQVRDVALPSASALRQAGGDLHCALHHGRSHQSSCAPAR